MAYADQQMSGNKITALIVVAVLHVVVGYALVTGLAASAFKKVKEVTAAIDIKEEKPKEEPPPPPPKQDTPPPPIVAPPPPISFNAPAPQIQTVQEAPPPPPAIVFQAPPSAPPAPPPPPRPAKAASPKGNPGNWVTENDYPSRARREEQQGVTGFRLTVGPDGKVSDCQITRSSGSSDLDEATCSNLRRRARFNPAVGQDGQPMSGSYSSSVRWQLSE